MIRATIARWLAPDMAKKADMHDWLVAEIEFEHRWLSEFKEVKRTLGRILALKKDVFREDGEALVSEEKTNIADFRDALRNSVNPLR